MNIEPCRVTFDYTCIGKLLASKFKININEYFVQFLFQDSIIT